MPTDCLKKLQYELDHLIEDRRNAHTRIEREEFQIDKMTRRIAEIEKELAEQEPQTRAVA